MNRWLFVNDREGGRIFRVSLLGYRGTFQLPDVGLFSYRDEPDRNVEIDGPSDIELCHFEEGEVVCATPSGRFRVAGKYSFEQRFRLIVGFALLIAISLILLHLPPFEEAKWIRPQQAKRVVTRVPAKPAASKRLRQEILPIPPPRFRVERNDLLVKKARAAFVHGEIDLARSLLDDLKERGRLPPNLNRFDAEVDYAICSHFVKLGDWKTALPSCESANREHLHVKASKILQKASIQARKLYLEGYVMESSNPAAAMERYRRVLAISPQSDPYRQKAGQKLKLFSGVRTD